MTRRNPLARARFYHTQDRWEDLYTEGGHEVTISKQFSYRLQYPGIQGARHKTFLVKIPSEKRPDWEDGPARIRVLRDPDVTPIVGQQKGAKFQLSQEDGPWVTMPLPDTFDGKAFYRHVLRKLQNA